VLGPRISLAEQRRNDGHQDCGDYDLGGEGEPEAPTGSGSDEAASCATHDADEDGHQAADGLHAGNQDAGDEADNDAGAQAGPDALDFHGAIQSLPGRNFAFSRQGDCAGNCPEVLLSVAAAQELIGEQCIERNAASHDRHVSVIQAVDEDH
jgi:hypothetical protein